MNSRRVDVSDGAQVKDDVAQGNTTGSQGPDGPALVLGNSIAHRDDVGKVDRRVDAHDQHAVNLLGIRVLLHIPATASHLMSEAQGSPQPCVRFR